jgi:FKBP-type peptidyl-prolyl cis-trans isomerase
MKSNKEKVSYCIGLETGRNIKGQFAEMDSKLMVDGFQDAILESPAKLSMEEVRTLMTALKKQIEEQQKAYVTKIAEDNKIKGEAFLALNKKKEDVKVLNSGLQYRVLKEGNGASPKITDMALVHYEGKFIDDTVFDSTYVREKPQPLPVNQVIPGWSEALQKMKVGDKWELTVPSYLAYGEMGYGREIPPNAVLIFEMELLDINPK